MGALVGAVGRLVLALDLRRERALLPGRAAWALPLAMFALALALRALEYIVSALGFGLTLPWRRQTIDGGFHWSYDR